MGISLRFPNFVRRISRAPFERRTFRKHIARVGETFIPSRTLARDSPRLPEHRTDRGSNGSCRWICGGRKPGRAPLKQRAAWTSIIVAGVELTKQGEVTLVQEKCFTAIHVSQGPTETLSGLVVPCERLAQG
jgi:hypothetical protein